MAEIVFRSLVSTESGVGATTGRETAKFFNENFRITKENLEAIWAVLQDMVGSKNIEGIRVKPYYNPEDTEELLGYYMEFTDNPDLTVEEDYQKLCVRWQDIIGSPLLNNALAQLLAGKVDVDTFQEVSNQVDVNTATLETFGARLDPLEESQLKQDGEIRDLQQSTKSLEEDIQFKVDLFRGEAKIYNGNNGTDYIFGDVIDSYPAGSGQYIMVTGVDENGSVTDASYLPNVGEPSQGHILVSNAGTGYIIGDVIAVKEYSIVGQGTGYEVNDIIKSGNGNYYKVLNVGGAGEVINVLPTQIRTVNTSGNGVVINDSADSTSTYAQVTEVSPDGGIEAAIVAEGPNVDNPTLGSDAVVFYTYGTGAQLTFQGYNTIMFRYNTIEPINAGDPPKGIIYSIADGAPGTWKSMIENIPFVNIIGIKKTTDYSYNTLSITNPDGGELLPYAYGYNAGDKVTLKGYKDLEITITAVDDNGTPTSFTPETFYSDSVMSGIYSTDVLSTNWFNSIIISSPGAGYEVGDTFTLESFPTTSPVFTVTSVDGNGAIQTINPTTFSTSSNMGGSYYASDIAGRTPAVIYVSPSSGNAAFGLRFQVNSTPKTQNTEFDSYITDLIKALDGSWNSDIEAFNFVLNKRIDGKVDQVDFDQHLGDFANPHNVTKEQIGLDAVDNTSDMDKPISKATLERFQSIDAQLQYLPRSVAISKEGYDNLVTNMLYNSDTFYFVTRGNPPYSVSFAIYNGGYGYKVDDTFTIIGSYNPNFEGKVTKVDANGTVEEFVITNPLSQVDFDISGMFSTTSSGTGYDLVMLIGCELISG